MVDDNQPRYTTKRLHDEIAKAKDYARRETQEEEAQKHSCVINAGKHLAVKLAEVYRAAGQRPSDCQAIRDWIAALKSEGTESGQEGKR